MTFSIIARDKKTGHLGVAVASCVLSVGSIVPLARAGVGVVVQQALPGKTGLDLAGKGLKLVEQGMQAKDILPKLLADDPFVDGRQFAFVDKHGTVAAHTGKQCIEAAAHLTGDHFSVQGNLLDNGKVIPSMHDFYKSCGASLGEALAGALQAGDQAGGDLRGRQSAALIVVNGRSDVPPSQEVIVDLRVENHPDAISELMRLLKAQQADALGIEGDAALLNGNSAEGARLYGLAADLNPGDIQLRYWQAIYLIAAGDELGAKLILKPILGSHRKWIELTKRLLKVGAIQQSPVIERLLSEALV